MKEGHESEGRIRRIRQFRVLLFVFTLGAFFLAYLNFQTSGGGSQSNSSVLVFAPELFSGDSEDSSISLIVVNDSSRKRRIKSVISSCACAVNETPSSEILPGDEVVVPISINWGHTWGEKRLRTLVEFYDGHYKEYQLSLARYPRLSFLRPYTPVLSATNSCCATISLVSYSNSGERPRQPSLTFEGQDVDIEAAGSFTDRISDHILKHVFQYKVSARSETYQKSTTRLKALSGDCLAHCDIHWYFKSPISCSPDSIFLGRVTRDTGTKVSRKISVLCKDPGEKLFLDLSQGQVEGLTLSDPFLDDVGRTSVELTLDLDHVESGPFYKVADLHFILSGQQVVVPVRVSGAVD